jgi:DNA-binding NtrC family response regulator
VVATKFVLIVDDAESRLYTHKAVIRDLGCLPLVAVSYAQALRLIAEHPLACVVIDDQVRTFQPTTMVNAIKVMCPGLPVIVGHSDESLRAAARMASTSG